MRICDVCKVNPSVEVPGFEKTLRPFNFYIRVSATRDEPGLSRVDLCQSCAAKAVLMVMSVEPEKQ